MFSRPRLFSSRKHREALEGWQKTIRGKSDWSKHIRVHEAGHAVAGYLMGDHLRRINIRKRYRRGKLQGETKWSERTGKLKWPGFWTTTWYVPRPLQRLAFGVAAGEIAEYWFFDRSRFHWGDWSRMTDLMRSYVGNQKVADRCFWELRQQAIDWFTKPRYMEAVGAVANALEKKRVMSSRETQRIMQGTGLKPLKKWRAKRIIIGRAWESLETPEGRLHRIRLWLRSKLTGKG